MPLPPAAARYNRGMSPGEKEVLQILEELPDDASLEDIQYHIARSTALSGIT